MASPQMKRLREAEKREAAVAHRARVSAIGAAVRAEKDESIGRDLSAQIAATEAAAPAEVKEIAAQLYKLLPIIFFEGADWIHLYKAIDEDDSGRISFRELQQAVRRLLQLDTAALPDAKLKSLWKVMRTSDWPLMTSDGL